MAKATGRTEKIKCPFTGKMIPKPAPRAGVGATIDPINPKPLPAEVTESRKEEVARQLAELRQKWVNIGPSKRSGITGDKLMKSYRKLALEHWHLTGKHPPPIYDDL